MTQSIKELADQAKAAKAFGSKRKHLLARMAGNIAAGLMGKQLPPEAVCAQAVNTAKDILRKLDTEFPDAEES